MMVDRDLWFGTIGDCDREAALPRLGASAMWLAYPVAPARRADFLHCLRGAKPAGERANPNDVREFGPKGREQLLSQTQAVNDALISFAVHSRQVLQQAGSRTDHLEESAP